MMLMPPPNGLSEEPPAGVGTGVPRRPPKSILSEPKALVAPASGSVVSVIGRLSFLSGRLSCRPL